MGYIVSRHPLFQKTTKLDVRQLPNAIFWHDVAGGGPVSIEGGDILVLNRETLMIGTGERTAEAGLDLLLDLLRANNSPVRRVVRAILPKARATMHLDTVFTVISREEFMLYEPVINAASFRVYKHPFEEDDVSGPMSLDQAMEAVLLEHVKKVQCGFDNELFQSREQWTDGANLFAIAPGILLGYDRNSETVRALQGRGYRYLRAAANDDWREIEQVASAFSKGTLSDQRIIIGLPGSELSRARGGARCMTMPLERDPL